MIPLFLGELGASLDLGLLSGPEIHWAGGREKILLANPSDYSDSMALYFADAAILVVASVGDFDEVNSR